MTVHICVGGLLLQDDGNWKILLGHRSPERSFAPDVWDFPGGHQESGETVEHTLIRELREEIGVTPTAWYPLGVLIAPDTGEGEVIFHAFVVTAWDGVPMNLLPDEHTAIAWFSIEDACNLRLAAREYMTWLREMQSAAHGKAQPQRV